MTSRAFDDHYETHNTGCNWLCAFPLLLLFLFHYDSTGGPKHLVVEILPRPMLDSFSSTTSPTTPPDGEVEPIPEDLPIIFDDLNEREWVGEGRREKKNGPFEIIALIERGNNK